MDLDEFSDDGFDDLTDHALQELERNAIRLTQARCQPVSQDAPPRPFDCDWGQEDEDLDTTEVINHVGHPVGRPVVEHTLQQQIRRPEAQPRHRTLSQVPNPRWNPNVDPAKRPPAPMFIRAAAPPNPHFAGSHPFQHQAHGRENAPSSSSLARPLLNQSCFSLSQASQAQPGDVVSALQQRVRALESELNAARGEASILRTKSTKAQHEHDIQLAQLKTSNADQLADKERLVEAAMAAQKSANTELQFLQRDMKEFSNQSRRKNAAPAVETGIATPHRASKSWRMADGFHEMDLAVGPSKGQTRGRTSGSVVANIGDKTPSKGKRKRLAMDSPVAALDTHTEDVVMADGKHTAAALPQNSVASEIVPAAPFEFLQLVLDHGTFHGQPVTFDILSRFSFPSDPTGASLASMIFEKLPLMGNTKRPMQLLVDFVEHVISLWARCVDKQFWEPVKYLVSLVSFTFDLHTISVAPHVILKLVPVARSTIILVAKGRRRGAEGRLVPGSDDAGALEAHLDTSRVLSLLHTSALACATTPSETENGFEYTAVGFWKLMSLDMVILLLSPEQRLSDIIGMLDLLATSALPGSLGPVSADLEPAVIARAVIGRVSAKLTEQARNGLSAYRRRQVRLAALRTLVAFSRYPFGALQLAAHSSALPRLVTCLSGAINDLYDQPVPLSALPPLPDALVAGTWPLRFGESGGAPDLYRIISLAVLLLHALVTDPATASVADIGQKLSLAYGTSQRYLLALGRLTFAEEDQIIEAGIDSDVVEAAHELLELSVMPDEGETISEVFGA